MKIIDVNVHTPDRAEPRLIKIDEDATIEELVDVIKAEGAVIGELEEEIFLLVENEKKSLKRKHRLCDHGIKHGHHIHFHCGRIRVVVAYTGHDDYDGKFSPETTVGKVKLEAMAKFEIEKSAADKYVMQNDGVNLDDKIKIGDFRKCEVKFVLLLKKPQEKGYVG